MFIYYYFYYNRVSVQPQRKVLLQVLPVQIHSQRGLVYTYAVLDPGSDSTLIRKDLADSLQLRGEPHQLNLCTVGSDPTTQNMCRVSFCLSSNNHPEPVPVNGAWVINKLNIPSVKLSINDAGERWCHLSDVDIPELEGCDVTLLIGSDMAHLLIHLEVRQGRWDEPIAIKTPLGWTLFGIVDNGHCDRINANFLATDGRTCLQHQIERFWEIDSYATKQSFSEPAMSTDDKQALKILQTGTVKEESHYKTPLLWDGEPNLPNNRAMAVSRLHCTEKKLKKNPELAKKYQDVISDYVAKGHARKMTPEEAKITSSKMWYLPHHAVLNPNKPGKVRVVFDAASRFDGVSLNDKLLTGPDLLNNLVGILIRFRSGKIGVMADVEQMFHQVGVCEEDRDSLRFLWRDLDETRKPDEYQMTVHVFGAVDSPCCANYALQRAALDQQGKFSEDAILAVKRNFYVDDLLTSKPNPDEATNLAKELIEILATGGFRLTKWMSNSREVLTAIPSCEVACSTVDLDRNELPQERALGVKWCVEQDSLCLQPVKSGFPDTKRGILSATSSMFDPLGLAAPYMIKAKLIIQELWRRQIDWDEELPDEILQSWQSWKDGLNMPQVIAVPRWYGFHREESQNVQLHVFCDASEVAYGAVAYLRTVTHGRITVSFVMSKTRLAPIKTLTVPRLELQAAVTAIRLKSKILEEIDLNVDQTHLWSDSKIVLHYISNTQRRFSVYVSHRVAEIVSNSDIKEWHHIPGAMNVADDCTRGIEIHDLTPESRWISGPEFLTLPEEQRPSSEDLLDVEESELEVKTSVLTTVTTPIVNLVEWEKYSSWRRLVRLYAWWIRYKFKLKCKVNKESPPSERQSKMLSAADLQEASLALCKQAQIESFKEDYEDLRAERPLPRDSSLLPLQPILVNGIIRVGGRLNKAPIPFEAKHQVIIPPTHRLSRLIIQDFHEGQLHVGREHTLALVRQQFWIPHGKSLTRKIVDDCLHCRKRRVKPNVPMMASLPKERLALCEPPFTNAGVDYFGPMYVKRGRVTEKRWGCLFTCLTARAVHLKLAGDMSTDSFIMALRRFRGRRGNPKTMRSDNGTNFVGANNELREALESLNQERITSELAHQGITWYFNPPASLHMGGIFESLVKQAKRAMKTVINDLVLPEETLHMVLVETESILNGRPLIAVSDDLNDYEALTPNHFLIGRASPNSPPGQFEEREVNSRKRWRRAQALADMIWRRWRKEYLPCLTVRSKWNQEQRNLQEGDLILLKTDDAPRSHWPLGRVVKTFPGSDGRVRIVEVKTPTGTLMRPAAKLCLLEESK